MNSRLALHFNAPNLNVMEENTVRCKYPTNVRSTSTFTWLPGIRFFWFLPQLVERKDKTLVFASSKSHPSKDCSECFVFWPTRNWVVAKELL